jgi:WD40 repeat protein
MNAKTITTLALAGLAVVVAGCGNLVAEPGTAIFVRYAPDGTLVVFTGSAIELYSPDLATKKAFIPTPPPAGQYPANLFNVSDDGSVAAVSFYNPGRGGLEVDIFDLAGVRAPLAINLGLSAGPGDGSSSASGLTLSPSGDLLFVLDGVDRVLGGSGMFDGSTGARLWTSQEFGISLGLSIFSPDGSTLYAAGGNNSVDLEALAARTGTTTLDVPFGATVWEFGGMPDAGTLIALSYPLRCYSGSPCPTSITSFSTADGSVTKQFPLLANTEAVPSPTGVTVFRCSTAAGLCVVGVADYNAATGNPGTPWVQVWSTDGTLVQSIQASANDAAVSPDGQDVAIALSDGDLAVFSISDGKLIARTSAR